MADKFDPYREALIIEADTIWPDEFDDWDISKRTDFEIRLHASPDEAAQIKYVRMHTGFCRQITVTPDDVARLS